MDTELLIQTFPKLYHMAHVSAWEGIQRHGLLSTTALLDLYDIHGARRYAIESMRRKDRVTIEHPIHGRAVIRDNKPMDDVGLRRALIGITPQEWYELLNRQVFFWLSEGRVQTLLEARAYRNDDHCVLTIDTRALVERNYADIWLCPMNSGCTKPYPHPRGRDIFQRIVDYRFDHWRQRRNGATKAIVELAVDKAVTNISQVTEQVTIRSCRGVLREVWHR